MARPADESDIHDAIGSAAFQAQPEKTHASYHWADFLVIAAILALGALAFFSSDRAGDFLYDDVYYADCARSLLERGFYGIADRPETTQPPGVSGILALLCLAGGCTRAVFLCAMAVFETLGFIACYALLRRLASRAVAGVICLLLMSATVYFSLATQWVSTCFPYLFATMSALLVARKLEKAGSATSRIAWAFLLSALLAASLMFGSTAIALLGGSVVWIAVSTLRDRGLGVARWRMFFVVLLVGVVVEGVWMHRKPQEEWPVPGFPGPYLQQIQLKDGHYPELGKATPRDIPARIARKAFEQSVLLADVLFRRWLDVSWASVLILGPALLILVGWSCSVWKTGGGLEEWYFAGCEFILFLWPWRLDPRSFLPLVPLACLYIWRGALGMLFLAKNKARVLGAVWLPVAAILTMATWPWMLRVTAASPAPHIGLQAGVSFAAWMLSGILAGLLVWKEGAWVDSFAPLANLASRWKVALHISPKGIAQLFGGAVVAGLIVIGVTDQLKMRRSNLDANDALHHPPPDLEAALWLRTHSEADAVVMARQVPITYHYSGRKLVWFPPSSNPQILKEGIRKYKVNYVILIRRRQSYFLPPEEDCFAAVLAENGSAFRLVAETAAYRIYETENALGR